MDEQYYEEEIFNSINKPGNEFSGKEFEQCTFENCDFSECNFSRSKFSDCCFVNCNLSMIKIQDASMKTVDFDQCKISGVDFSECNDFIFEVGFNKSILDFANFSSLDMKYTKFVDCHIHDANFNQCNLESSSFNNCDLKGAIFERTILVKCNFSSSYNYIINPNNNNLKKALFSLSGLPGLLTQYNIIVE